MKLELIGHDEKYALEQSLLTLFPGEKPVYGTVDKTADTRWARVTLTEEDERVQVTTELGVDGKSAAHSYDYPLSGTEYEKEGQRRHAVGISFFGAAKDLLGISPAWGSLTGVRPSKVALSLIREGGKKRAEKELQELYCVTPARARLAIEAADAGIRAAAELEPNDISLYVGIPFCPTRCAYCSFVAQSVEKSFSLVEPYLEALFDEITAAGQLVRELGLNVKSFYMGGGTPTTLTADQMDRLLSKLEQNFDFGNLAELTIEAGRPDTIDEEKLRVLRAHNTTRVSINPQTMEDNVLAAIGRRHTADDIRRAMEQVKNANFPHVNMDLIAGLPEDTPEGFARSLDEVISMGADNVTVHTLSLKKGSRILLEGLPIPGPEDVAAMAEQTGCDGYMIARGAEGNPWIFRHILHYFETGEHLSRPDFSEVTEMLLRHAKMQIDCKGDYTGIREIRKHAAWYTAGYRNSSKLRGRINEVENYEQLEALFREVESYNEKNGYEA